MTQLKAFLVSCVVATALPTVGFAAELPTPGHADARIRFVTYDPNDVVQIAAHVGFHVTIAFAADEHIETVMLGDSQGWQATPSKRADLLFVKPLLSVGNTNMTVVTDRRTYNFDLVLVRDKQARKQDQTFTVRFQYRDEDPVSQAVVHDAVIPPPAVLAPENWNLAYTYKGSKANVPTRVFDDGKSTYFQWADGIKPPAILLVKSDKSEVPVNYAVRGRYVVIDQVAPAFVLRSAKVATVVYNDGYRALQADSQQQSSIGNSDVVAMPTTRAQGN